MNYTEIAKRIEHLIVNENYTSFALQDKNLEDKIVALKNCLVYPKDAKGYKKNANTAKQEIIQRITNLPGQVYRLYYSRQQIHLHSESEFIDTRSIEEQTNQTINLADMDERNKEERRYDEISLREANKTIGELLGEIKYLREKNDDLNDKIDEYLELLEEERSGNKHAQMADATTSTIGQVVPVVMHMAEKYFALQTEKNALLAEQIRRQAPPRPQPTNQTQEQPANGFYYETEN